MQRENVHVTIACGPVNPLREYTLSPFIVRVALGILNGVEAAVSHASGRWVAALTFGGTTWDAAIRNGRSQGKDFCTAARLLVDLALPSMGGLKLLALVLWPRPPQKYEYIKTLGEGR